MDPSNHKSIIDIQNEAFNKQSTNAKGKRKASAPISDEETGDENGGVSMDVDFDDEAGDTEILPMPVSGGIESLREKLHARMSQLRRGGGEAGDKDDLLEERRRQRAAMRERRRKETREKIRTEEEMKGKKSKEKEKEKRENRDKGNVTKVMNLHLSIVDVTNLRINWDIDSAHCPRRRPQFETISRSTINDGDRLIFFFGRVIEERSTV